MVDTRSSYIPERHPFQILIDGVPSLRWPYEILYRKDGGYIIRVDMPGAAPENFKNFKKLDKNIIGFRAIAPTKQSFPYDESKRSYAGYVKIDRDPKSVRFRFAHRFGVYFLILPDTKGTICFMPPPKYEPSQTSSGEGAGDAKSGKREILGEIGDSILDKCVLDAMNLVEGSETYESVEYFSHLSPEGLSECITEEPESTQGSEKATSDKSFLNKDDEAWIRAFIKKNILQIDAPEEAKEESAPVETSPAEKSGHEVPEIAIGSVKECSIHSPQCQCQNCDSDGVCLKLWSTTEDIIEYGNKLKISGPDGVCEKRVIQEGGLCALYVRADLPGFDPDLCVTEVRNRCLLVYGKPKSQEHQSLCLRNYLLFLQPQCSCCRLDIQRQDIDYGVLRLFCKII